MQFDHQILAIISEIPVVIEETVENNEGDKNMEFQINFLVGYYLVHNALQV